jgi:hypothetical protein
MVRACEVYELYQDSITMLMILIHLYIYIIVISLNWLTTLPYLIALPFNCLLYLGNLETVEETTNNFQR